MKERSNYLRYTLTSLLLLFLLMLIPELQVSASEISFNLSSDDIDGGSNSYAEGISATKSGYMVYLVNASGAGASPDAKLISSSGYGFSKTSDAYWSITSRLGGYTITKGTNAFKTAPFGAPFEFSGGFKSREPEIRAYMSQADSSNITNAYKVIQGYWGTDYAEKWVKGDFYLVLEPIYEFRMWYQYSIRVQQNTDSFTLERQTRMNAPILVGNVKGLATLASNFLSTLPDAYSTEWTNSSNYQKVTYTFKKGFTNSGMSSGYARAFCRMEYLSKPIGSLSAGSGGGGYLTLNQILNGGWGMLAISAHDTGVSMVTEEEEHPDGYCRYEYMLSASGKNGSTNSGNVLFGDFYSNGCASGDDAYSLACNMSGSLSYSGSVPSVVYSGSGYDMYLETHASVRTGAFTANGDFPYVKLFGSMSDSDFSSFTNGVTGCTDTSITMLVNDDAETYLSSSDMGTSGYVGGSVSNTDFAYGLTAVLSKGCWNNMSGLTWNETDGYSSFLSNLANVYSMGSNNSVSGGLSLFSNSELGKAYVVSRQEFIKHVSSSTLSDYWTSCNNTSKLNYMLNYVMVKMTKWVNDNAKPVEVVLSKDKKNQKEYDKYIKDLKKYSEDKTNAYNTYEAEGYAEYDSLYWDSYTCTYSTGNQWSIKLYSSEPYRNERFSFSDKIPINCGPSNNGRDKLFSKGYRAYFKFNMWTTGVGDTTHLITFLPFTNNSHIIPGECSGVYDLFNNSIPYCDFIIPNASSMDTRY